jgi:Fe-S-cluster-containing dehydrogenase component
MSPLIGAEDLDRRAALKLLAGGAALTLTACSKPPEEIVPYVEMPERLVPGEPLKFATTLPLGGYGRGVMAIAIDGRPIKIEGNPRHPASLGATDVFAEAAIMSLYDPDRSKAPRYGNNVAGWQAFGSGLRAQLEREAGRRGAGLRLLTNRVTSPTLLRQIDGWLKRFPEARWHRYESIADDNEREGSRLAFGRPLTTIPRLSDAAIVLALDADPLGPGPLQITNANGYAQRRKRAAEPFLRLYAAEPVWSATGANADHRLALHPELLRNVALQVSAALRGENTVELPAEVTRFAKAAAADLMAHRGHALVLAGPRQPAEVHALCHWINAQLQAPVDLIEPIDPHPESHAATLKELAGELHDGHVETLLILDANPAYDAPGGLDIAQGLKRVAFGVHLGRHDDETAALCAWHLPLSHALESWSDLRAFDGTASVVQPLIRPLYDSRTAHDVLALLTDAASSAYDTVRQTWQAQAPDGDFETWWRQALHDGVVANSKAKPVVVKTPVLPDVAPATAPQGIRLVFQADNAVWDGVFANNAWLQECPRPLTKEVWGNSLALSPGDAGRLGVRDGDVVTISHSAVVTRAPVRVHAGQADGVIAAALGYGRRRVGAIGNGVGFDVNPLRPTDLSWHIDHVAIAAAGDRQPVPSTQQQFRLEGEAKDLYPILTLAELAQGQRPADQNSESPPTLYPSLQADTYAWAMVIDTGACIGCNACVIACQAENNVPVVGPQEIARGRDMHWLRVDSLVTDAGQSPGFQPVPCMHCEHAPCEPVCPVAASVHDGEGLNVQVYNRCIGTRFCQANCPYKVRRFNWFGYADGQEYADLGNETVRAAHNPDVSVRPRGVMEKCTYCVQRISRARRASERENRTIAEGEVVTACQSACPTRAISFGDKNDQAAQVHALREEPHHYALLGHLGTRPRTTYLAHLRNPNPALQEPKA